MKMFSKKGILLLISVTMVLGAFIPICNSYAADAFTPIGFQITESLFSLGGVDIDFLGKIGVPTLNAILSGFFMLLMAIGTVFLEASSALLSWVISPDFITLKFTDNIFVNEAWGIVRNFVNMFFVLILVIIGLSTALRVKEYEAQKTLPLLIGMALLINFTPMICGFFIDISNIIMNFFLDGVGIGLGQGCEQLVKSWDKFAGMISTTGVAEVAGYGFSMALFTFITAFVYLIFAFLFIIRYLALWILVILSPLAFFAYILPATRGAWKMWWQQFTQWCIVGIGGAFFLYLAEVMNVKLADVVISPPASAGNEEMNAITAFFPFLIPVVFLIIGVFATLSTSAIGATQGISLVTKGGKLAGGKALSAARGTQTGQKVEGWARKTGEKIPIIGPKPGTYQMAKETEREKKRDYMKRLPQNIREQREKQFGAQIEDKDILQQIAIEKGERSDTEDKAFMKKTKSEGIINLKETYEKRPDLAPNIQAQIKKETPKKFVEQTNAKALRNIDVVSSMSDQQRTELGKKGSVEQIQATQNAFTSKETKEKIVKLEAEKKAGDKEAEEKLDKIAKIKKLIEGDANFA